MRTQTHPNAPGFTWVRVGKSTQIRVLSAPNPTPPFRVGFGCAPRMQLAGLRLTSVGKQCTTHHLTEEGPQ